MDTTRNQSRFLGFLIAGAIAGMIGGAMMAMFTMLATVTYLGMGFFTPLYVIASPLVGRQVMMTAMHGGAFYFALGPAVLGLVVHMMWSALWGIIFGLIASVLHLRGVAAVVGGMVYGVLVMLAMSYIVGTHRWRPQFLPTAGLADMDHRASALWHGRGPLAGTETAGFHRLPGSASPPGCIAKACPLSRPGRMPGRERGATALPFHAQAVFHIHPLREGKRYLSRENRKGGIMHLEIYISDQCTNCQEAVVIAEQARTIAGLEVTVVNLDAPGQRVPPQVFATPTYVLNGLVVSLGNPERTAFLASLRAELARGSEEIAR